MIEYGSDFHECHSDFIGDNTFERLNRHCLRYFADGREAIEVIVGCEKSCRIWVPGYFCYDVIKHIEKNTRVTVMLYDDNPLRIDDSDLVRKLPYEDGDILLRVNYFGLRTESRTNAGISVPVIEDHTHDIISDWSLNSDADWCIASLRKSIPIATGGVLWSPKGKALPPQTKCSEDCSLLSEMRYMAMSLKSTYLEVGGDKSLFREKFIRTEEMFDYINLSGIDTQSLKIFKTFDIVHWETAKLENWNIACDCLNDKLTVVGPMENGTYHPFSLIFLCASDYDRILFKQYLVDNCIYPALLWHVPETCEFKKACDFSSRMLSVHCDARYTEHEIIEMCNIINKYYD